MSETQTQAVDSDVLERPSYDDVNTPVILLVAFISAVVTFLIIALVQGMCYHWEKSYLNSMKPSEIPAVTQIEGQKAELAGGDGVLSIDEAMNKVVEKFGN